MKSCISLGINKMEIDWGKTPIVKERLDLLGYSLKEIEKLYNQTFKVSPNY